MFVGGALSGAGTGCATEFSPMSEAPKLSEINESILEPSCTFACHSGGEFAAGGLDLQKDPFGALVDAASAAPECAGTKLKLVEPGKPEQSLLYLKVIAKNRGVDPSCGQSMPQGPDLPSISDEDAERIHDWIAAGAVDD